MYRHMHVYYYIKLCKIYENILYNHRELLNMKNILNLIYLLSKFREFALLKARCILENQLLLMKKKGH